VFRGFRRKILPWFSRRKSQAGVEAAGETLLPVGELPDVRNVLLRDLVTDRLLLEPTRFQRDLLTVIGEMYCEKLYYN